MIKREEFMSVDYSKLQNILKERKITLRKLHKDLKIDLKTLTKFSRKEFINLKILVCIALYLDCKIDELIEYEYKNK